MDQIKQPYTQPAIEDLGDLLELTEANRAGSATDATFPQGTPVTSLTFSF
jgi:hypothetical protein